MVRHCEKQESSGNDSEDLYAVRWDLENEITEEERRLVAQDLKGTRRPVGRIPEKRYERRQKKEIQWFRKYLKPFFELVLRVSLNPFLDHSAVVAPLAKTPAEQAELRRVLDLIIQGD